MIRLPRNGDDEGAGSPANDPPADPIASATPYRSTPVFDEATLPPALRERHMLKEGAWGVIRVIHGRLKLTYLDPESEMTLDPATPGYILPQQAHFVTPLGPMKMQVDFYDQPPRD
jgi:hemoglobin